MNASPTPPMGHNAPPSDAEILAEKLAEKRAPLVAEVEAIADRANALPGKIRNDDELDVAVAIVKDARTMEKRLETIRKEDQQPFTDALETVRKFFRPHADRVERVKDGVQKRADAYTAEKAAAAKRAADEERRKAEEAAAEQRRKAEALAEEGKATAAARALDKADALEDRAAAAEGTASQSAADLTRVRGSAGTASARTTWQFGITDLDAIPLDKLRPYLKREHIEQAIGTFVRLGGRELKGVRIYEQVKANIR